MTGVQTCALPISNVTVVAPIPSAQIPTEDGDAALIAVQQTNEYVLRGALTGAARAKESENLTRFNLKDTSRTADLWAPEYVKLKE